MCVCVFVFVGVHMFAQIDTAGITPLSLSPLVLLEIKWRRQTYSQTYEWD